MIWPASRALRESLAPRLRTPPIDSRCIAATRHRIRGAALQQIASIVVISARFAESGGKTWIIDKKIRLLALTARTKAAQFRPSFETIQAMPVSHEVGVHNMNKNDLISAVADSSGLTKSDASKAVEGVFDAVTAALKKGDEVRLVGFGTFSVAKRKASTGRNPRTGEPMTIKASTQPKFKAGKGLKDAVN
jgi:DNA-binding protein HU-beta